MLDELLAPLLLGYQIFSFFDSLDIVCRDRLTLLEPEYCPTSLPVRIARGSISGQLAPVLIQNTQVLHQALDPYRTRVNPNMKRPTLS